MKFLFFLMSITLFACTPQSSIDNPQTSINSSKSDNISEKSSDIIKVASNTDDDLLSFRNSRKGIFAQQVSRWESMSEEKKQENYPRLLKFEVLGDNLVKKGKYFKAWDYYGVADIYYPSAFLLKKAGDAYFMNLTSRDITICRYDDCQIKNANTADLIKYKIRRRYQLALDFNEYSKQDYPEKYQLTEKQVVEVKDKVSCLEKELDFDTTFISSLKLNHCVVID